jgi:hypothetical protein
MIIVVASAGHVGTATAPVTAVVVVVTMAVAFRRVGIVPDQLCALRATTIMLIRVTVDLSATKRRLHAIR